MRFFPNHYEDTLFLHCGHVANLCGYHWSPSHRTHDEDEVLHKFVWSMYKFVLSRYTFTPVHSTKVCLVPNKGVVFEQTLFKCASFIVAFWPFRSIMNPFQKTLTTPSNNKMKKHSERIEAAYPFRDIFWPYFRPLRGKRSDPRCLFWVARCWAFLFLDSLGLKKVCFWSWLALAGSSTSCWIREGHFQSTQGRKETSKALIYWMHVHDPASLECSTFGTESCDTYQVQRQQPWEARFGYADDETLSLVSAADAKKQAWKVNVGLFTVQWIHSSWPHMTRKRSKHKQVHASHLRSEAMNCQVTYEFAWLTWVWKQHELIRRLWTGLGRGNNPQDIEPKKDVLRVSIWSKWSP